MNASWAFKIVVDEVRRVLTRGFTHRDLRTTSSCVTSHHHSKTQTNRYIGHSQFGNHFFVSQTVGKVSKHNDQHINTGEAHPIDDQVQRSCQPQEQEKQEQEQEQEQEQVSEREENNNNELYSRFKLHNMMASTNLMVRQNSHLFRHGLSDDEQEPDLSERNPLGGYLSDEDDDENVNPDSSSSSSSPHRDGAGGGGTSSSITTSQNDGGPNGGRDEVHEIKKLIQDETASVRRWRWVVVMAMLVVSATVTTATYWFLEQEETSDFETSVRIYDVSKKHRRMFLGSCRWGERL